MRPRAAATRTTPTSTAGSAARRVRRPVHARGAGRRARRARPSPGRRRWPTRRSWPSSTRSCASTPALPSPLYFAERLSDKVGARILLKREDLNHTGAHKIRNVLGQALLTKRMGKTRVIAETGAGQHGVASATAAAYFGLDCTVYMGSVDTERQALNVARMHLLGAEGRRRSTPAAPRSRTRSTRRCATGSPASTTRPTSSAPPPARTRSRAWSATSCRGIGDEARAQCLEQYGALPDAIAACVGGGSNAIGLFTAFLDDADVDDLRLRGRAATASRPAATPRPSTPATRGVLHGARTYVLQDEDGQTIESHSISAGLDYPGVGPQHAYLADDRAGDVPPGDRRRGDGRDGAAGPHRGDHPGDRVGARARRRRCRLAAERPGQTILVNLSGRGDKDMGTAIEYFEPRPARRRDRETPQ